MVINSSLFSLINVSLPVVPPIMLLASLHSNVQPFLLLFELFYMFPFSMVTIIIIIYFYSANIQ